MYDCFRFMQSPWPPTAAKLRKDIYKIIDRVLATGEPVEIVCGGRKRRTGGRSPDANRGARN